jgi:hypothetical protein
VKADIYVVNFGKCKLISARIRHVTTVQCTQINVIQVK